MSDYLSRPLTEGELLSAFTKHYADFRSRSHRLEYFLVNLVGWVLSAVIQYMMEHGIGGLGFFGSLVLLAALIIPSFACGARRCHDLNLCGWWMLLGLVPIANILLGIYLLFWPSKNPEGN